LTIKRSTVWTKTIIRAIAIGLLTASISDLVASDGAKAAQKTNASHTTSGTPTVTCPADQQNSDQEKDNDQSDQNTNNSRQKKIKEQEEQWLNDLQGIYG
jgi:hypothetical protein